MTPTEKGRRFDALYHGESNRSLATMVVNRESDLEELRDENARLRELVALMYRDMQGVLDMSTDTVWVDDIGTLRDGMDYHMHAMDELGIPPADYEQRMRELGVEAEQ